MSQRSAQVSAQDSAHPANGGNGSQSGRWGCNLGTFVLAISSLAVLFAPGCGATKADLGWVGEDAAVVVCTRAGKEGQTSRLLREIPYPSIPSGLFAGDLQPRLLHDLGYEQGATVCATLQSPTHGDLAAAATASQSFADVQRSVDIAVQRLTPCWCEAAGQLRKKAWLPSCIAKKKRSQRGCNIGDDETKAVESAFAPFDRAMAEIGVPLKHWRLIGPVGRVGRFATKATSYFSNHPGGSQLFKVNDDLDARPSKVLLAELLKQPDVVGVVRQDSGRAILVARETGGHLVLDHFSYPKVHADFYPLLGAMDNSDTQRYVDALAKPTSARSLDFKPSSGWLFELSYEGLSRVDAGLAVGSWLSRVPYRSSEDDTLPPSFVERVSMQVPFDDPKEAQLKFHLSDDANDFSLKLNEAPLSADMKELPVSAIVPTYRHRVGGPKFLLQGTPVEQVTFSGIHALPALMATIELGAPGTIRGTAEQWHFEFPSGPMPGSPPTRDGLRRLRERFSLTPYEVSGDYSQSSRVMTVEIEPQ